MSVFRAELKGRDSIEVDLTQQQPKIKVVGCTELLSLIRRCQIQFGKDVKAWPLPKGTTHSELLLKEVLQKSRGQWNFPYADSEICHCRSIPTTTVDQAIVAGAHQTQIVSRQTSASTACGTCRVDVQKIIDFRLKNT